MCGICGVFNFGDSQPVGRLDLERMRDTLTHRGPDDAGCYFDDRAGVGLGFRRLSIIDLSPAGHQPMSNEDGSIWTVFNGETYNYRALRCELEKAGHRFASATDTETLLHGYEQWGLDVVGHMRGMFAFALWDGPRRRLVLARDRVGIKPLYYHVAAGRLAFGSELKAVLSSLPSLPKPNVEAIYDYLTYNYIPAPKTAYQGVFKLPAGHLLIAENGQVQTHGYWDVSLEKRCDVSEADAVAGASAALTDAVSSHLVADVPVGVFLSGGMDSSSIAVIMATLQASPVETFSIGFESPGDNELPYARLVADQIGSSHHEGIVSWPDMQRQLRQVVDVYDEPFADSSSVPTLAVSRLASEHVKVVLSGEGGDEAFAGYDTYAMGAGRARGRARTPAPLRSILSASGKAWPFARGQRAARFLTDLAYPPIEQYGRLMEWISMDEKRQVMPDAQVRALRDYDDRWYFRKYWREDVDPVTRLQYLDLKTYLADDLLVKVDRASMAVSLEARVPMLDHPLLEDLFRLPASFHMKDGRSKSVLRAVMAGSLPGATLGRKKMGFAAPLSRWFSPSSAEWARTMIRSGAAVQLGLLRPDAIDRVAGKPAWLWAAKVWVLLVLETWARKYAGFPEDA
jgi:asparagine synthase (glutamine-hydrolysing)